MSKGNGDKKPDFWQDALAEKPKADGRTYRDKVKQTTSLYEFYPASLWAKIQRRWAEDTSGETMDLAAWWRRNMLLTGGLMVAALLFGIWFFIRPPAGPTMEPLVLTDPNGEKVALLDPVGLGKSGKSFIQLKEARLEIDARGGAVLRGITFGEKIFLRLLSGSGVMQFKANPKKNLYLVTDSATFLITGTEWIVEASATGTTIALLSGSVKQVQPTTLLDIETLVPGGIYSVLKGNPLKLIKQTTAEIIKEEWQQNKTLAALAKAELKPKKKKVVIILKDSSQITGTIVSETSDKILLKTGPTDTIEILKSEILSIQK